MHRHCCTSRKMHARTLRLPSLPSHCTSVSSRSPQAPAPVRREMRSAVALAHSAALSGHDPTTSKPPAHHRESPPLLSRPTPLHVTSPTTGTCYKSQLWAVASPGPPWNPNFETSLQPLRNPSFGMLLPPLRNPNFWTLLQPMRNPSFGRCCRLCETLASGRSRRLYETLALGLYSRPCEALALGRCCSRNFYVSSINFADQISSV